ncbi:MAG: GNAT family N-acetyltransferase [Rhodobacteraceae bacterium]|nr:MAG: GNAT family N-acetyltransferase [Paracoccaceae bacterium]
MIIRAARAEDAVAIRDIVNALVRDSLVTFTTVQKTSEQVRMDIAGAPGQYLVAEQAGKVVGHAHFGAFRGGPGYRHTAEHTIHLAPTVLGKGVGRALLVALEQVAAQAGIHVLVAAISGANSAGMRFHLAMGYSEVGRLPQVGFKDDQWLDMVLMQKILPQGSDLNPDSFVEEG